MNKILYFLMIIVSSTCLVAQSDLILQVIDQPGHRGNCPENSLVSNPSTSGGQALVSSTDHGTINYLKFDGTMIPQNSTVQGFIVWALFAYHDGQVWIQCSNDNLKVRVTFLEDDGGVPGELIHSEDITASTVTTNSITFGSWIVKEVAISLSAPVIFDKGFITIASTNSPNCWLMAIDSHNGIPNSYVFDNQGNFVQRMVTPQTGNPYPASLGFCLLGEAPNNVMEPQQMVGVSVYPNPATGVINVESIFEIENIKIFDTAGRLIFNTFAEGKSAIINTSSFKEGVYILQVNSGTRVQSSKIQIY